VSKREDAYRNPYRWVVLGLYTLVAGVSQMLWLNFAPLLTQIQTRYGVSELMASTSFWALLAGQVGIAVAQPFVVNGISKLVVDWFSEEQGAIATGLGTMGMFIGMAAGMALTPVLVESLELRGAMIVFAAVSTLLGLAFVAFARENDAAAAPSDEETSGGFKTLIKNRDLLLVFALSLLGLGFFNGLTTWLEAILAPNGVNAVDAGLVGGLLIIGGIVGAVVIPALSDRFRRRKPFVIICTIGALAALYPLCTSTNYTLLLVLAAVLGFFFLPAYALLLEMSAELAGPRLAGSATGILMLTGNAGGVIVIIAMQVVKGDSTHWNAAVYLMLGLLAVALLLAAMVAETARPKKGFKERPSDTAA